MPYILPQVRVRQSFDLVPAAAQNSRNAYIVGANADLIRFGVPGERDNGRIGFYDDLSESVFPYPTRPSGAIIDKDYFKLWVKDALLEYYLGSASGGLGVETVAGSRNQVVSGSISFASNGSGYPHSSSELKDRGAKIGDIAKVRTVPVAGSPETTWTYVKGFAGDPVSAIVGSLSAHSGNQGTLSQAETVTQVGGFENCLTMTADGAAYDGFADGCVSETYTVLVTGGSAAGDLTSATLRITSASGKDDQLSVVPGAESADFAIGTRGLTINLTDTALQPCQGASSNAGVSSKDLIVGQKWTVQVNQAFTPATPASSGSYTGSQDTTYIVDVVRGPVAIGPSDTALVRITTNTGYDSDVVEISDKSTEYLIGNHGVKFEAVGELYAGDRYLIQVTSAAQGANKTIILGHNLPDVADGTPCDLSLYIRKPEVEISYGREGELPLTNYELSDTEITIPSGITAVDESWTDGGVTAPLPVKSHAANRYGEMYAEYRLWLSDLSGVVYSINDTADINDIPGPLDPDNPLKFGVFKALSGSAGSNVKYSGINNQSDYDQWSLALDIVSDRTDVYGLVPLSRDQVVLDMFGAHVNAQTSEDEAKWRCLWVGLEGVPRAPVVHAGSDVSGHRIPTSTDEEVVLATISDDLNTSGTQYTRVVSSTGNAGFIENGVRPKDRLRINYSTDGFGVVDYDEYEVDRVVSEDELYLKVGSGDAIPSAIKIEVWRNLEASEEADEIGFQAGSYGSANIMAVWPDLVGSSGGLVEGYFLCAGLAGLVSGVAPHQGLTHVSIPGFTDVERTTRRFSKSDLNSMAESGVWIVTQDPNTGQIYTRHAVTTGNTDDINQREEMIRRNVNNISYRFHDQFSPYIGVANVTDSLLRSLRLVASNLIVSLKGNEYSGVIGPQLIDGQIIEIRQHALLRDHVVMTIRLTIPYSLNNLDISLVV